MRYFRRGPRRHITLFGKPGCHLCDDARAMIDRLGRRYRIEVEEVDITSDPVLYRKYDIVIPVVLIDGVTELTAPIRERDLTRVLKTTPSDIKPKVS